MYVEFSRNSWLHADEDIKILTDMSDAECESLHLDSSKDLQLESPVIREYSQPASTSGEQYRRSQRSNRGVPPERYVGSTNCASNEAEEKETLIVKEALAGSHKEEWERAMNDEIESHVKNGTWEIVPRRKNKNLISCNWVFKIKRNAEGLISCYKHDS